MLNVKTQIRNPNSEIRNALPVNSKSEIRNSKSYARSVIVTLGYMCVLFILSSIPGGRENGPLVSAKLANIAHVPAYGLLALLWIVTLRDRGVTDHQSIWVAFLVASAYGALTELNQVWIPGRFPSASDVMFDVVGSLLFIWLYWWLSGERRATWISGLKLRIANLQNLSLANETHPKFHIRDSKF